MNHIGCYRNISMQT